MFICFVIILFPGDLKYNTLTSPEPSSGNCIFACFDLSCSEDASKAFISMFAKMQCWTQKYLKAISIVIAICTT